MSSPVQKRKTRVGSTPSFRPVMSQPWTSPAELAKYTVLPEMATEFSMLNWRSLIERFELGVPARGAEDHLGVDRHEAVGAVGPVELDDVEPAVLAALEEVVVDDQAGAVPVVVPHLLHPEVGGAELPQLDRFARTVGAQHPVVVVARPRVGDGEAVGVGGDRPLDDVAGRERGEQVGARLGVEPVHAVVVGAERHHGAPVLLVDVGLARPARAAPGLGAAAVGRVPAHRALGVGPQHLGREGTGPSP